MGTRKPGPKFQRRVDEVFSGWIALILGLFIEIESNCFIRVRRW